mmetsp:Transcript_43264/g.92577  ORF Transcript_43264/g.92577 Transcript_43264/m.92577 type:complete len:495 (-) Transcript_43264:41-1525(-)|eukprot:CAMPEP_0206445048 /NCGR_PEP_ID=MMETSP0324_2-20121206/15266_1 /ASSEMBLY_ACC=CAM_ASM_000836 /TAXON_ID=2866 /ORGANISM="Crypthecodinium cohnii, Strain Seligo" /LENGTH=494 /DNA_ID=CAMNT_0053913169 /DNA_START=97 /DNA_END=1581 /DNA_ORIENTATION=-
MNPFRQKFLVNSAAPLPLLLLLLLLRPCHSSERSLFKDSADVTGLNPKNFAATVVADTRAWVIAFYADWCGHCIHYAPTYKSVAAKLKDESRVKFGALNCAVHSEFCQKVGVHGYPTVKAYHFPNYEVEDGAKLSGAAMNREDYRDQKRFVSWVESHIPSDWQPPPAPQQNVSVQDDAMSTVTVTSTPAVWHIRELPEHEQRLWDAEVALLYSLSQGTMLKGINDNGLLLLQGEPLEELCRWTEHLAALFPSKVAREELTTLAGAVCVAGQGSTARLDRKLWNKLLDDVDFEDIPREAAVDPNPHFAICKSFTCGLWTLFHILTLAAADMPVQPPSAFLGTDEPRKAPPEENLLRIRGFAKNFFGCSVCSEHFLETFDSCAYGRCELKGDDGVGAALWLSQVHNVVNARVAQESSGSQGQWPPHKTCESCWKTDDEWEPTAVYSFLRRTYLPAPASDFLLDFDTWQSICLVVVMMILVCFAWRACQGPRHGKKM